MINKYNKQQFRSFSQSKVIIFQQYENKLNKVRLIIKTIYYSNKQILNIRMIKVVENENTSKLTKSLLSMIRIYVVNLLMAEYAVETVSKEAIECLVMHLLKFIAALMIKIKKVVSSQGRTIPNFLHLLFACQSMGCRLDNFSLYLQHKQKTSIFKKPDKIIHKFDIKKLVAKQDNLFLNQKIEQSSYNILTIPLNYLTTQQLLRSPLPVRINISQTILRPPHYTYEQQVMHLDRNFDDLKVLRQRVHSQKQIKTQLAKLKKQKMLNTGDNVFIKQTTVNSSKYSQIYNSKNQNISFDLFKYL